MATWVDFAELRKTLRFADVLRDYSVEVKAKGDHATGFCPLPGHNGQRRTPSFSADLKRGIFQCFGCGAKGNALDFAVLMEGGNPEDGHAIRAVALRLHERHGSAGSPARPAPAATKRDKRVEPAQKPAAPVTPADDKPRVVNSPIDFELKHLDAKHQYLYDRGLTDATIAQFGLGFCARGLMSDRIAIPLHDPAGQLVGYAGRFVDDALVGKDNPKYLFPGERERNGVVHEFRKGLLLYNLHRLPAQVDSLVLVEGFASVWHLTQIGITPVVAVMGASVSPEQAMLAVQRVTGGGQIVIFTDGDEAGGRCAVSAFSEIASHRLVRWARLSDGRQPTDCSAMELRQLLGQTLCTCL